MVVEFLRPIPAVALIPLAILWFGLGTPMVRFVVAYAAVWPILVHTVYGIRGVDRMLYDVAASSGVTGVARVARVSVPAALPGIATGIRVSAAIALTVCVTAEFFFGNQGIGAYMQAQQAAYRIPELYAGVFLVGLVGLAIDTVLRRTQRRRSSGSARNGCDAGERTHRATSRRRPSRRPGLRCRARALGGLGAH